jgi:hypothetical protein
MHQRILVLYKELRLVERELDERLQGAGTSQLAAQVAQLEKRANGLRVPLKLSQQLYDLKEHIHLVRARVAENNPEVRPANA